MKIEQCKKGHIVTRNELPGACVYRVLEINDDGTFEIVIAFGAEICNAFNTYPHSYWLASDEQLKNSHVAKTDC